MNPEDRLGPTAEARSDFRRVEVGIYGIRFRGHDRGADSRNCKPRRNIGVTGDDYLVPSTDADGAQDEGESLKTVSDAYAVADTAIRCKFLFKRLDIRAEDIPTVTDDPGGHLLEILCIWTICRRKVEKGDHC